MRPPGAIFRYDRPHNRVVLVEREPGRVYQTDTGSVYRVALVNDEVWLGAANGAFRYDPQQKRAIPVGVTRYVKRIALVNNEVWLGADRGALRYDPSGRISVKLNSTGSCITSLLGSRVSLAGNARLETRYSTPFEPVRDKTYVILAANSQELHEKEASLAWQPIKTALYELTPPETAIHVSFRDDWGNVRDDILLTRWVVPTWGFATVSLLVLATAFWLLCLALAPNVRFCHLLMMNPYLRKFGSFGVVPILLTVAPPIRRHLFRRYRREMARGDRSQRAESLQKADTLQKATKDYVLPKPCFEATAFLESLSTCPVVVIHGQSGIGKSAFLKYLAYSCASSLTDRSPVPVFIDLSLYKGIKPKEAILAGLEKYGELTDRELVEAFLDQGGFLFLFDGVNEVSEDSMRQIAQFVDTGRKRNYACLTTQVPTQELLRIGTSLEAQPLQKEKVEELIRKRIPEPDLLLKQFTDSTYRLCRVPLQLELLVEIRNKLTEAYRSVMNMA